MFSKIVCVLSLSLCLLTTNKASATFNIDIFDNTGYLASPNASGNIFNNTNVTNILAGVPDIQTTTDLLFFGDTGFGDFDIYASARTASEFFGNTPPTTYQVDGTRTGGELTNGGSSSSYIARAQGTFQVDATDVYTLAILSDDNYAVNIDGQEVAASGYTGGRFQFLTTTLTAGLNSISVLLHNSIQSGGIAVGLARGDLVDIARNNTTAANGLLFSSITTVPEPSSVLLLLVVLLSLGMLHNAQKKKTTVLS